MHKIGGTFVFRQPGMGGATRAGPVGCASPEAVYFRLLAVGEAEERDGKTICISLAGYALGRDFQSTCCSGTAASTFSHTFLKVGDMAPDFTLRSDQGTNVKLSDYRGKQTLSVRQVIVYRQNLLNHGEQKGGSKSEQQPPV